MSTTTREVERKYEAPEGAATPPWQVLKGLGQPASTAQQHLDATYYDTDDMCLLADGITLRRRTGGEDAGWHLKLPVAADTRDEIHAPDTGQAEVPAELLALTRSRTRGRPLAPIATINTTRHRRRWTDEAGRVRLDVVDDHVEAHSTGNGHHRAWRELEVELGPGGDPALLDVVEGALVGAGAQRSTAPSKLARALGGRGPAPARTAPSTGRKATVGELALAYVAEQAAAMVRLDPAVRLDVEDSVHQMRVSTRRLRSALQAFGREIERDATRALTDELKWLAGELGAVRDLEVLRARVAGEVAALGPGDVVGPVQARVTKFFAPRQGEARRSLVEALDSDRYLALLAAVDALLDAPPLTDRAGKRAKKAVPDVVDRAYRRVEGHLKAADAAEDPDVELHEARKAAKRVRYAAEAAGPVLGKPAAKLVEVTKAFQDLLGEHQDAVVARPVLKELALEAQAEGESAFTFGVLYGRGAPAPDPAEGPRKLRKAVRALK